MSNQPTDNYDEYDLEDEELDDPQMAQPQNAIAAKPPKPQGAIRKAQPPSNVVPLNRKAQAAQPQNAKPQMIAAQPQPQSAGANPQVIAAQPQSAGANPQAIAAQPQNTNANPPIVAAQPQAQEEITDLDGPGRM